MGDLLEELAVAPASATISEIIGRLRSGRCYEVFLEYPGRVGMVTIRDMLRVRDIAKAKPSTLLNIIPVLERGAEIGEAVRIMSEHRIRALPVVVNRKIRGQVTATSIIGRIGDVDDAAKFSADDVMTKSPIVVERNTKATAARGLMIRRMIDHLPVLHEGNVYGIVTSSHLIDAMLPSGGVGREARGIDAERRLDFAVDRILDRHPARCAADDDLPGVATRMLKTGSTYSLVMVADELQGIITYRDILRIVSQTEKQEETPIYIIGLPEGPFESEAPKRKFLNTVKLLKRVFPEIEEVRAVVKKQNVAGPRHRYEVKVKLTTPYRTLSFVEQGWELPSVYDRLSDRMKKLLAARPSRRKPMLWEFQELSGTSQ